MKRSLALAALPLVVSLACAGEKKRERVEEQESKESPSETAASSASSTGEQTLEDVLVRFSAERDLTIRVSGRSVPALQCTKVRPPDGGANEAWIREQLEKLSLRTSVTTRRWRITGRSPDPHCTDRTRALGYSIEDGAIVEREPRSRREDDDDDLASGSASADPSAPSASPLGGAGGPPSAAVMAGVKAKGGDTYELAQVTIDWIFEHGMKHAMKGGRSGRVPRVRPGTLGEKLGFKSGDVVKTINGFDITTPEGALDAYVNLRKANRAEVVLERDGKKVVLTYVRSGT